MLNRIRGVVSKKKIRYQEDGFDLDLTYITDNIIAMGFPAEEISGLYRNPMSEVQRFFHRKHDGHFKVFNLCSERDYDADKFDGRVACFPFDDHNAAPLRVIIECCKEIHEWLTADSQNVAAVHCKAGKGRTGMMISAYLVYSGEAATTKEALDFFGTQRTHNEKGVTIPSQMRFVTYFENYLKTYERPQKPFDLHGFPLVLTKITLFTTPNFDSDGGCDPYFIVTSGPPASRTLVDTRSDIQITHMQKTDESFDLVGRWPLRGDLKFDFYDEDILGGDDAMFHFWIHSSFVPKHLKLKKSALDGAHKDKKNKHFDPKFRVELFFEVDPNPKEIKGRVIDDGPSDTIDNDETAAPTCNCGLATQLKREREKTRRLRHDLDLARAELATLRASLPRNGTPFDTTSLPDFNSPASFSSGSSAGGGSSSKPRSRRSLSSVRSYGSDYSSSSARDRRAGPMPMGLGSMPPSMAASVGLGRGQQGKASGAAARKLKVSQSFAHRR